MIGQQPRNARRKFGPALFLVLLPAIALWLTAHPMLGGPGLTWDEAYYYPAYRDAARWVSSGGAIGITAGWEEINELPPVTKWFGAATFLLPGEGWNRLAAMRVFPALLFGLTLLFLWLSARRLVPRNWAWLAPALYAAHPVITGHAQLAASETVFCCVMSLNLWLILRGSERTLVGAIALAVALGLALATKVNGLILVVAVSSALLGGRLLNRRRPTGFLKREGRSLLVIAVLAPVVALAVWPWMWEETGARLAGYWRFIAEHSHQGTWFAGQRWNFGGPPAPLYYPFAMAHLMTPLALLAIFWAGAGGILWRAIARLRLPRRELVLLLFLLGPLSASSLPSSPKYDGVRLFLPMFAPALLLAIRGCWILWVRFRRRRPLPLWVGAAAVVVSAGFPSIDFYNLAARSFPSNPSPWETTYWVNGLDVQCAADLNTQLKREARVKTLALQPLVVEILTSWGVLRGDIIWNGEPPYDYHLVQNRRGFWGNAEWSIFVMREPLAVWGKGATGEPLMYLYDGRPPGE